MPKRILVDLDPEHAKAFRAIQSGCRKNRLPVPTMPAMVRLAIDHGIGRVRQIALTKPK